MSDLDLASNKPPEPASPPLSVPVPPEETGNTPDAPGPASDGVPPLSVPVPPQTPDSPTEPGPEEPPLSVPVEPAG